MKALVLLFFTIPVISLGQGICFDFEDHDLTGWIPSAEGHWCISEENALEGRFSLKHCYNNDQAGRDRISWIHDPLPVPEAIWSFRIAHQYAPSANNNWAVIISENDLPPDDGTILSGIIIGVNYTGNSDVIAVWEAQGGIISEVLNTGINWQELVLPGAGVFFELSAQQGGNYMLRVSIAEGQWAVQGEFCSSAIAIPNVFSLLYRYTASYDQGLWLDDLCIEGNFTQDSLSPAISAIYFLSSNKLEVNLNEPVILEKDAVWQVAGMTCLAQNSQLTEKVKLQLPDHLVKGRDYVLEYPLLTDIYGNELAAGTSKLYFPRPYDLLISEIMADPSPPVGLPETEYVCLLNISGRNVNLKNWDLNINGRSCRLPPLHLNTEEEIILIPEGSAEAFEDIHTVHEVASFPSLNNSGAGIILSDASGALIHAVHYRSAWHESDKNNGGWSLEMQDPSEPCIEEENWHSSGDLRGGTPGELNSSDIGYSLPIDPEFWRVAITDSGTVKVWFSEAMDSMSLSYPEYYQVDQGIGHPALIIPSWPEADNVELKFTRSLTRGVRYEISITSDLCDCAHNSINYPHSQFFQFSEEALPGDILINEILFDPEAGRIEFIELYNNTGKRIDLKDFRLIVGELQDSARTICSENWPLDGGRYALIAEDIAGIDCRERFRDAEKIIEMPDMQVLPNSGAEIYLLTPGDEISDAALYLPDYHHEILAATKGVSLERISPDKPGFSSSNWTSASSDVGYMTPGEVNSQTGTGEGCFIRISPETITQSGSGGKDILTLEYHMDREGYMAEVFIFNPRGERKYTVARTSFLGVNGFFEIKGSDLREAQLRTGYYILFFNAYHEDGSFFRDKAGFVFAR